MSRMDRVEAAGLPDHITQRSVRSIAIFNDDRDRRFYLRLPAQEPERHVLRFTAWCLMTNHVHLVMVSKRGTNRILCPDYSPRRRTETP